MRLFPSCSAELLGVTCAIVCCKRFSRSSNQNDFVVMPDEYRFYVAMSYTISSKTRESDRELNHRVIDPKLMSMHIAHQDTEALRVVLVPSDFVVCRRPDWPCPRPPAPPPANGLALTPRILVGLGANYIFSSLWLSLAFHETAWPFFNLLCAKRALSLHWFVLLSLGVDLEI